MSLRSLVLFGGIAAVALYAGRSMSQRGAALPRADGPVTADGELHEDDDDLPLKSLAAGMPADMHADADRARPGFADYARGA